MLSAVKKMSYEPSVAGAVAAEREGVRVEASEANADGSRSIALRVTVPDGASLEDVRVEARGDGPVKADKADPAAADRVGGTFESKVPLVVKGAKAGWHDVTVVVRAAGGVEIRLEVAVTVE